MQRNGGHPLSEWHDAEAVHKRQSGLLSVVSLYRTIWLPDPCAARVTGAGSSLTAIYTLALRRFPEWMRLEWMPRGGARGPFLLSRDPKTPFPPSKTVPPLCLAVPTFRLNGMMPAGRAPLPPEAART